MPTTPEPAAIQTHALDHLQYIRDTMQRAAEFTSVSGAGAVMVGAIGVLTTPLALRAARISPKHWLLVWTGAALLAAALGAFAMSRKAARQGNTPLLSPLGRRFLLGFATPLVAGAVLTYVLYEVDRVTAVPGTWLLLYGTAFVTGGAFSVRVVPLMGICFMALGILTFFLDFFLANLALGAGFGLFHIIFGIIITRRYGG